MRNVKKSKSSENERVGYIFTNNVLTRWIGHGSSSFVLIKQLRTNFSVNILSINLTIIVLIFRCSAIKVIYLMTTRSSV